MGLGICRGCRRFARHDKCPFCGGDVLPGIPQRADAPRVPRTALALVGAMAVAACSGYGIAPRNPNFTELGVDPTLKGSDAGSDAPSDATADADAKSDAANTSPDAS